MHGRGSLAQRVDAPFLHSLPGGDVAEQAIASLPVPDAMKDVLRNPLIGQIEIAADVAGTVAGAVGDVASDVAGGIVSVGSAIGGFFSSGNYGYEANVRGGAGVDSSDVEPRLTE